MQKLEAISAVHTIEKLSLTAAVKREILERTDEGFVRTVEKNNKQLNCFKVVYKSNGHKVVGYIVQPKNIKGKKLPVIILNRGGSGEFGALSIDAIYNHLGRFASWGYIVFASQYSGNAGSEGKDEFGGDDVKDVLTLKKLINAHPYADEQRIGMIGSSRGGMMTYQCLAKVRWVRAAVVVAGMADFFSNAKLRPEMKRRFKEFFTLTKSEITKRSAVCWVDKFSKKTPLLMMHGTADWRVPVNDSITLAEKLYKHRVPYKLIVYPGADHQLTEYQEERWQEAREWFEKYLAKKPTLPNLKLHGR